MRATVKLKGKLLKCDRCGATIFLKYKGTQDMDGGFSDVYEDEPKDWHYLVGVGDLCPTCHEEYRLWLSEFKSIAPKE